MGGSELLAREVLRLRREVDRLKALIAAMAGPLGCAAGWFKEEDDPAIIDRLADYADELHAEELLTIIHERTSHQ